MGMEQGHLAQAMGHIACGEQRGAPQKQLIERLVEPGADTLTARGVLQTF